MKKFGVILGVGAAIAAVVLAGCGTGGNVAEINGQPISREEFNKYVQVRAGTQMLTQMLDDKLTMAMAKEKGVEPTDEQVEKQLKVIKGMTDLDEAMKQGGLTMDDVKAELKVQQARQNLAVKAEGDKVTDTQIKQAYDSQKAQRYDLPERVKTEMLIFRSKEAAEKAYKDIEGGSTLDKVAEDGSLDHSPQVMKQMIPKSGPGMPKELAKAAFDTPTDKVSKPFKVAFGVGSEQWILLKPGSKMPASKVSLEDAKPMIRGELAMMAASQDQEYQKELREARKKAKVKVLDPGLKQAQENFLKK